MNETRFNQLPFVNAEHAEFLLEKSEEDAKKRYNRLN